MGSSPETDDDPKGDPFAQFKPTQRSVCSDSLKQRLRKSDCIALTEVTRLGAGESKCLYEEKLAPARRVTLPSGWAGHPSGRANLFVSHVNGLSRVVR